MTHFYQNMTYLERLLINSFAVLTSYFIQFNIFIFTQVKLFILYSIIGIPKPQEEEEPYPVSNIAREQKGMEDEELKPFMIRKREHLISNLIVQENKYRNGLDIFSEYYYVDMADLVNEEEFNLLFGNLEKLDELSFRISTLLEIEFKKGPVEASLGSIFVGVLDGINYMESCVDNYMVVMDVLNNIRKNEKKKMKKIRSIQRRSGEKLSKLLKSPLKMIIKYQKSLKEMKDVTPKWHFDSKSFEKCMGKINAIAEKAKKYLKEVSRIKKIEKVTKKIRHCPDLINGRKTKFIGAWPLCENENYIYVFSDVSLIVQQKTEIISRKKYFLIKKILESSNFLGVESKRNSIIITTINGTVNINIKIKKEELEDIIKTQINKLSKTKESV